MTPKTVTTYKLSKRVSHTLNSRVHLSCLWGYALCQLCMTLPHTLDISVAIATTTLCPFSHDCRIALRSEHAARPHHSPSHQKQSLLLAACHAFSNYVSHVRIIPHTPCHDITRYVTQCRTSQSCVSGKFPMRKKDFLCVGYIREPGFGSLAKWQAMVTHGEKTLCSHVWTVTQRLALDNHSGDLYKSTVRAESVPTPPHPHSIFFFLNI